YLQGNLERDWPPRSRTRDSAIIFGSLIRPGLRSPARWLVGHGHAKKNRSAISSSCLPTISAQCESLRSPCSPLQPVQIALLRSCYGQILGPRGHLPKFAYSLRRRLDAWVYLDPHLIRQAAESYMERRNAF